MSRTSTSRARRTGVVVLSSVVLALGVASSPPTAASAGQSPATATLSASVSALTGTTTAAAPFRLIAVGDIARSGGAQAQTASLIAARDPKALLILGDTAYDNGSVGDYGSWFEPTYGRFRSISWPLPGNHDYNTVGAAGFRTYFGVTGTTWWAKRAGAWLVIGLDSEQISSAAQRAFVVATLRANQGRPTLVAWHRPRYSSGVHRDQRDVAPLWKLVSRDRDVQLALWGHDHDYERMLVPVSDRRAKAAFVVGTGGAELRGATPYAGRTWSKRIITQRYGVLDLRLGASSFTWRFVRTDGVSSDAGTRKVKHA